MVISTHMSSRRSQSATARWARERKAPRYATQVPGTKRSTVEYAAYAHAKMRCNNPADPWYSNYGGRGIEFKFESFTQFIDEIGLKPDPTLSLDRIDNNGHYEPGNVRWATKMEQDGNRRTASPLTHGTLSGYTHHKCRCDLCRAALASYMRERRRSS